MKRIKILVGALACSTVLLTGGHALAANPHFVQGPTFTVTEDNALQVTGKVAGLGNTESVLIVLEATAVRECTNPGSKGHKPPGLTRTQVTASDTFSVDNGQVTFSLMTDPEPIKPCPGKQMTSFRFEDATVSVFVDDELVLQSSK